MAEAISNTTPLLYMYRIGAMAWVAELFDKLRGAGMWMSDEIRERILRLAGEVGSGAR